MKLLATDLDRTLLPNGSHAKDERVYRKLSSILKKNDIGVIYVTGKRKDQLPAVMKRYSIPKPLFCITSVGTEIYSYAGSFKLFTAWQMQLRKQWKPETREQIKKALADVTILKPQSESTANEFKQSYIADVSVPRKKIEQSISKRVTVPHTIIYSVDVNRNIAQIDILPKNVNKKNALAFLLKHVSYEDVLVSGDSGNDLAMLTASWKSVLVKNAHANVKKEYLEKKSRKRYVATGNLACCNGNYAAGIVEAMVHYGWIEEVIF